MFSRIGLAVAITAFGFVVSAPRGFPQGRGGGGMRGPAGAPSTRNSFSIVGREDFDRDHRRLFLNNSGYPFPFSYYPWDDYDYAPTSEAPQQAPQVLVIPVQAEPPAAPALPLLLENHGGQWVRVPTGNEIPANPDSASARAPAVVAPTRSRYAEVPKVPPPTGLLPPAVIVYRDGRTEELAKYMIQGNDLYTTSDYYSTGSWTRKTPLAELDIPASLKLNRERGTNFNLPSGPNEIVIRF